MTPTLRQLELLKQYLRKVFVYRETYEELYDHIITALDDQAVDSTFEHAVNKIITDDFGGHQNLVNVETNSKKAIKADIRRQQSAYFWSFFTFPNIIYLLIFAFITYKLFGLLPLTPGVIRGIFLLLSFIPWFAIPLRYYLTGYVFGDTKRSVKDNEMSSWSMVPFQVFCAANIIMILNKDYHFINGSNLLWVTVGVVLYIVYTMAFFKLSKAEFKVKVTK